MTERKFEKSGFFKRLASMLAVDFRRMFTMPLLYILIGSCFAMPILILVMTTMMDGTVTVNPQTKLETVIEGFDNTWQIIGSVSSDAGSMDMGLTTMCNINMLYFLLAIPVCIFVAEDFRSGYVKNLFTVRAKKSDYVISKTLVLIVTSALMILSFILGSLLGGAISSLSFEMVGFGIGELIMCLISKLLLVALFVPLYLVMAAIAKNKLWLSLVLSLALGMLLFMMIPMLTPLDSGIINVMICLIGGAVFSVGIGAISTQILKSTDLI